MKTFCFITGIGVGILICHPDVVTSIAIGVIEKQAEAKRELVYKSKVVEEDLQAFLKQDPPKRS
jgi:hypothetical protein